MKIKTENLSLLCEIIGKAKLTKMEDADKCKVIKILRILRPTLTDIEQVRKDAIEKFKPEDWGEIEPKFVELVSKKSNISQEEANYVMKAVSELDKKVKSCINEEFGETLNFDTPTLSDSAFEKLLASNDWDVNTGDTIFEHLVQTN